MFQVNLSTGVVTNVGSYGQNLGSSGDLVVLSNGTIYATAKDTRTTPIYTSDLLVTLDPANGYHASIVGELTGYTHIYGLGFWAGILYGFDDLGNVLQINPGTASVSVIANRGAAWYGAGTTPAAPN